MTRPVGLPGRPNRGALLLPSGGYGLSVISIFFISSLIETVLSSLTFHLTISNPSSSHSTDTPACQTTLWKEWWQETTLTEAVVTVDPVGWPTLADDSTEIQLLMIELPAGMIKPSSYWEGGALWMGDQPLDWPQVPKSTQEMRSQFCTQKDVRLTSFGQLVT